MLRGCAVLRTAAREELAHEGLRLTPELAYRHHPRRRVHYTRDNVAPIMKLKSAVVRKPDAQSGANAKYTPLHAGTSQKALVQPHMVESGTTEKPIMNTTSMILTLTAAS